MFAMLDAQHQHIFSGKKNCQNLYNEFIKVRKFWKKLRCIRHTFLVSYLTLFELTTCPFFDLCTCPSVSFGWVQLYFSGFLVNMFTFTVFCMYIPVRQLCRHWLDAAFCCMWTGSALFSNAPKIGIWS